MSDCIAAIVQPHSSRRLGCLLPQPAKLAGDPIVAMTGDADLWEPQVLRLRGFAAPLRMTMIALSDTASPRHLLFSRGRRWRGR